MADEIKRRFNDYVTIKFENPHKDVVSYLKKSGIDISDDNKDLEISSSQFLENGFDLYILTKMCDHISSYNKYSISRNRTNKIFSACTEKQLDILLKSNDGFDGEASAKVLDNILNAIVLDKLTPQAQDMTLESLLNYGFKEKDIEGIHFNIDESDSNENWDAVIEIQTRDETTNEVLSHGSGVVVSAEGFILTAHHVVFDDEGNFNENVFFIYKGKSYPLHQEDILASDKTTDLALFKTKDFGKNEMMDFIPIAKDVDKNSDYLVVGFPLDYGLTKTTGKILSHSLYDKKSLTKEDEKHVKFALASLNETCPQNIGQVKYRRILSLAKENNLIEENILDRPLLEYSEEITYEEIQTIRKKFNFSLEECFYYIRFSFLFSKKYLNWYKNEQAPKDLQKNFIIVSSDGTIFGNSGGGIFSKTKNGTWQLLGICSRAYFGKNFKIDAAHSSVVNKKCMPADLRLWLESIEESY